MLRELWQLAKSIQEQDPARPSLLEVFLCYPGLQAVFSHRMSHFLYKHGWRLWARLLSQLSRHFTGIEIHPGAKIGHGLFIDHGLGVVIGETAEIGNNVTIFHSVTLGGTGKDTGKRHPLWGITSLLGPEPKFWGPLPSATDQKSARCSCSKAGSSGSHSGGCPGPNSTSGRSSRAGTRERTGRACSLAGKPNWPILGRCRDSRWPE